MGNSNNRSEIIYTDDLLVEIGAIIARYSAGNVFLTTENKVDTLWLQNPLFLPEIKKLVLESGEENKKLESVKKVWEFLSNNGADRKSLLINIGGGMLTDLCGFAASTFKRGIDFLNVPTTLLSQVDASAGGKTGINFIGLKNEIGTFSDPMAVIIHPSFLKTIDHDNFLSGFAEMIKHGLIKSPAHLAELKYFNLGNIDYSKLGETIRHSVEVKQYFVEQDPSEKNIRKALNFGHTIGHAIESQAMYQNKPILHGYAVAYGMMAELYLSNKICGLQASEMEDMCLWIKQLYGKPDIKPENRAQLLELMQHDKKNEDNRINFTLISGIGRVEINQTCDMSLINESLDFLFNN